MERVVDQDFVDVTVRERDVVAVVGAELGPQVPIRERVPQRGVEAAGARGLDMSLDVGSRLGPYQVTAKIGEGGMGEVYRATDTKLDRDVG